MAIRVDYTQRVLRWLESMGPDGTDAAQALRNNMYKPGAVTILSPRGWKCLMQAQGLVGAAVSR